MMISAPPVTPPDARLESASQATLVPAVDFHVTAPRIGYMTDAASVAAAAASAGRGLEMHAELAEDSLASASTSIRCEIGAP